jgi:DNA-binding XRE family transcriptional regulator
VVKKVRPYIFFFVEVDKKYQKFISKVASNIRKAREARELTQEDMTKFGFNYRHYQKIESGRYSFNLYTLFRLSELFKTDIKEFFE